MVKFDMSNFTDGRLDGATVAVYPLSGCDGGLEVDVIMGNWDEGSVILRTAPHALWRRRLPEGGRVVGGGRDRVRGLEHQGAEAGARDVPHLFVRGEGQDGVLLGREGVGGGTARSHPERGGRWTAWRRQRKSLSYSMSQLSLSY